jgi:hypothetical protein
VLQLWITKGERIVVADARRDNGKRFVVRADEKLTAFVELESAICAARTGSGLLDVCRQSRNWCYKRSADDTPNMASHTNPGEK